MLVSSKVNMPKADTTEVPSAAIRILESTEKVASAITSSLMGAKPVSISRRNLGKQILHCRSTDLLHD